MTVFSRNWGDDGKIAKFTFWQNGPFRGFLRTFLATLPGSPFFVDFVFLLVCLPRYLSTRWTHAKRYKTRGFGADLASFLPRRLLLWSYEKKLRFCGPNLDDNFFPRLTIFYGSEVRFFDEIGFWRFKNALGLQNRGHFQKGIFGSCVGLRAQIWRAASARRRRYFFLVVFACGPTNGLAAAVRRVFRVFFGFCCGRLFRKLQVVLFTPPSFCLRCFSLLFAFFLGLVATPHCTCVFGQLAFNPSFFGGAFGVLLEKHCFPPWKTVIWVHFSVSPFCVSLFVVLGFFHFSLSLFLSIYLSFFFIVFFLPCCLVFIFTFLVLLLLFLVLLLRFRFMSRSTSKYYISKFFFHNLCLFIFLFRLSNMFLSLFFVII